MWYKWFYKAPLFILLAGAFLILIGFVVMSLWNALIPSLFNGPMLTFWQAVGILVLAKIFLYHPRSRHWHGHGGWNPSYHRHWKKRFEAKLASMSPEDREKFKNEWRKRCSHGYWDHNYQESDDEQGEVEKK